MEFPYTYYIYAWGYIYYTTGPADVFHPGRKRDLGMCVCMRARERIWERPQSGTDIRKKNLIYDTRYGFWYSLLGRM